MCNIVEYKEYKLVYKRLISFKKKYLIEEIFFFLILLFKKMEEEKIKKIKANIH